MLKCNISKSLFSASPLTSEIFWETWWASLFNSTGRRLSSWCGCEFGGRWQCVICVGSWLTPRIANMSWDRVLMRTLHTIIAHTPHITPREAHEHHTTCQEVWEQPHLSQRHQVWGSQWSRPWVMYIRCVADQVLLMVVMISGVCHKCT